MSRVWVQAIITKSVQLWMLVIALSAVEELLVGRYQDVAIESPSGKSGGLDRSRNRVKRTVG